MFEIIIEGESREKVVNNKDNGYDNVKVFVSIDGGIVGNGFVFVDEISYNEGYGQVLNRFRSY